MNEIHFCEIRYNPFGHSIYCNVVYNIENNTNAKYVSTNKNNSEFFTFLQDEEDIKYAITQLNIQSRKNDFHMILMQKPCTKEETKILEMLMSEDKDISSLAFAVIRSKYKEQINNYLKHIKIIQNGNT